MAPNRFDDLLRSLTAAPSRRGALRLLAGSALGGLLTLDALPSEAKKGGKGKKGKKKKKKKGTTPTATVPPTDAGTAPPPPPPFCAGKNHCVADAFCHSSGAPVVCRCFLTVGTGEPFCAKDGGVADACSACAAGQTCVDISGPPPRCGGLGPTACVEPCPNPL